NDIKTTCSYDNEKFLSTFFKKLWEGAKPLVGFLRTKPLNSPKPRTKFASANFDNNDLIFKRSGGIISVNAYSGTIFPVNCIFIFGGGFICR
ncbi:MAG: hypothetical protein IJU14_05070, partial [Clostridia bacterium]|nr:hypothetical protein [Clostridia bacterium]